MDWEGIVEYDLRMTFIPVYMLPRVIGMCVVYSIFMLREMVGRAGNDGICKSRFSVNGYSYIICSFFV